MGEEKVMSQDVPRAMSLVKLVDDSWLAKDFGAKAEFLFLGEIPNMPGQAIVSYSQAITLTTL